MNNDRNQVINAKNDIRKVVGSLNNTIENDNPKFERKSSQSEAFKKLTDIINSTKDALKTLDDLEKQKNLQLIELAKQQLLSNNNITDYLKGYVDINSAVIEPNKLNESTGSFESITVTDQKDFENHKLIPKRVNVHFSDDGQIYKMSSKPVFPDVVIESIIISEEDMKMQRNDGKPTQIRFNEGQVEYIEYDRYIKFDGKSNLVKLGKRLVDDGNSKYFLGGMLMGRTCSSEEEFSQIYNQYFNK